jgi:ubiquinone/menaquinone biosynthesis C-methylase UbiE
MEQNTRGRGRGSPAFGSSTRGRGGGGRGRGRGAIQDERPRELMFITSPFSTKADDIAKTISKHYLMTPGNREYLLYILECWSTDSLTEQLNKMNLLLSTMKSIKIKAGNDDRSYKVEDIRKMITRTTINSILDIGAGNGEILIGTKHLLKVKKENAYAIEPQSDVLKESDEYTTITYDNEGNIPLPNESIDLIIIAETLHHIYPRERKALMYEIKRVLSTKGLVVIQEHAFDQSAGMQIGIEVIHNFWYCKNKENVDPLYLMTPGYCQSLFEGVGLYPRNSPEPRGWQKIYWRSFQANYIREVEEFSKESLFLTPSSQRLPWINRSAYSKTLKNGQLKLFLGHLQALVTFWDMKAVPHLTVVYAGFAPGMSLSIVDRMFPGMISWHLYDTNPYYLGKLENVKVHNKYFTDKHAIKWSLKPNVFFFTDIRRVSFRNEYRIAQQIDMESEQSVKEDMAMQRRWVELMKPYQASLKMKLPYVDTDKAGNLILHDTNYLDGNIMIQSFNGHASSESRLIPMRKSFGDENPTPKTSDIYETKVYDDLLYQEQLFYHNFVDKEAFTMGIQANEHIQDSYEFAHLLYVFDLYKTVTGRSTDKSSIDMATDVVIELKEMKTMQPPQWNEDLEGNKIKFYNDEELTKQFNNGVSIRDLARTFNKAVRAITTRLGYLKLRDY